MAGLATVFGSGAMTNSIAEIEKTDVMFVIGSNTKENHPIVALRMIKAKKKGAKLIIADPRRVPLVRFADIWMQHRPGTDVMLLNAMMHVIMKEGLVDKDFIASMTEGYDEAFKKNLEDFTPEAAEKVTGVPKDTIIKAARMYAEGDKAGIYYTMGITQHSHGTDNVFSVANLALMTGNLGKEGGGVNPLRGQNNVQGACDMGALPDVFPGYQRVSDPVPRAKFEREWNVKLSETPGLVETEMFTSDTLKAMYIMGENPALCEPNLNNVKKFLTVGSMEFLVIQDIFMTETAHYADVILPASSFAEKDGTFTNCERRVQRVRKAIEPVGKSLPDWQIICELSKKMGYEMKYNSPSDIMDEISQLTPTYG